MRAAILDWDGTTYFGGETLLKKLSVDYLKTLHFKQKIPLILSGKAIVWYMKYWPSITKAFDKYVTCETTGLKAYNSLFLKPAEIPIDFAEEKCRAYSKQIDKQTINAIKQCSADIYIISATPKPLIEIVLEEAKLLDCFENIFAPELKIEGGIIREIKRETIIAGISSKYAYTCRIMDDEKGNSKYEKGFALGDSLADIGMGKHPRVMFNTLASAPKQLQKETLKNGGFIFRSLGIFLKWIG